MKRNIVSKAIMGLALGLMVLAGTQNEVKAERSNADYSDFIRNAWEVLMCLCLKTSKIWVESFMTME